MSTDAHPPAPDLTPAALRRARLQAELAGLDALGAAKAVTHARRRHQGADREAVNFWHALYIELAPLPAIAAGADRHHEESRGALAALGLEERTALLLRVGERLSMSSISRVLDEPDDRVRTHLAGAVKRLRQQLANGREDHVWMSELASWVHEHSAAGAPTSRGSNRGDVSMPVDRAAQDPPKPTAAGRTRRSRLPLWLGLVAVLAAVGAARMTADRWISQRGPETAPVIAADPLVDWLLLAAEDAELIESIDTPKAVAQLDFLLWLEQTDPSRDAPEKSDATP